MSRASFPTRAACTARCTASRPGRSPVRGLRLREGVQRALPLPALEGHDGPIDGLDLPTQLGLDSDNPRCLGEVGRTGVAIDTIDDMRTAFDSIPLDLGLDVDDDQRAGRRCLLAALRAGRRGAGRAPSEQLRGTTQNDVLKEYIARGNYIYPPGGDDAPDDGPLPSTATSAAPKWNTISISGYHFREKGCSAVQEVAFTLVLGDRVRAGRDRQGPRRQ